MTVLSQVLVRSWVGRNFAAIRLNEDLAQTLGINTFRYKLLAFTISNVLAAFAGALFGFYTNYIEPSQLSITQSLDAIAMVLLGGMGSILGPVVGALRADRPAARHRVLRGASCGRLRRDPDPCHSRRCREASSGCSRVGAMFLEVDALTKRFGGLVAVSEVSLQIKEGEIVGILGPNGSGKTTLLNLLAGLLVPTSGSVIWQGRDISGAKPDTIAALGLVKTFQNPQLFAELSVLEHVMIASHLALKRMLGTRPIQDLLRVRGIADRELQARVDRVLTLCRLDGGSDKPAATLSYGEEKMLGVAMAMMCEPKLLLLDEPASGLGQEEIVNLGLVLRDLREHGTTLCIIDHKVAFLAEFAHRLIALQNGIKIAEGSPREVLANQSVITAYLGRQHAGA